LKAENVNIPNWLPDGIYIAFVQAAVAALGDSVAVVVTVALAKFPYKAIHVTRKGKPIKPMHYAFSAA